MMSFKTLILAAAMVASPLALAHDDAYLDTQKAPNGGQMRMAGPYHYELLVAKGAAVGSDSPIIVYVTDHAANKISTAGASGTATILSGKQKTSITLRPDGENRLKGSGKYTSGTDMKVIVSVTLAGKQPEQARFTPLAAPLATADHSGH